MPINMPEVRTRSVLIVGPESAALPLQDELQNYDDFKALVKIVSKYDVDQLKDFNKIVLLPMPIENARLDEVDQHTIHNFFMLRSELNKLDHHPDILVELASTSAAEAFVGEARCDVIVPAYISAHLIAHVGLRPELNAVFDEVLGSDGNGADMSMFHPSVYHIDVDKNYTFRELRDIVRSHGHILIGLRVALDENRHKRRMDIAPVNEREYLLTNNDRLVTLH